MPQFYKQLVRFAEETIKEEQQSREIIESNKHLLQELDNFIGESSIYSIQGVTTGSTIYLDMWVKDKIEDEVLKDIIQPIKSILRSYHMPISYIRAQNIGSYREISLTSESSWILRIAVKCVDIPGCKVVEEKYEATRYKLVCEDNNYE